MTCKDYTEANNKLLISHNLTRLLYVSNAWGLIIHMGTHMVQLDLVNSKYFNLDNYFNIIPIGCFLEIVLDYPNEQHDLHNDYPNLHLDLHNDYPLVGKKIIVRGELFKNKLKIIEDHNFSTGRKKKSHF